MTTTITASTGTPTTSTPTLVLGYETTRAGANITHELISGDLAVVLRPGRLRSGTLRLFYPSESAAFGAMDMHARRATFTLNDTDRAPVNMTYVVTDGGRVALTLDDETRTVWTVMVDFQEVAL